MCVTEPDTKVLHTWVRLLNTTGLETKVPQLLYAHVTNYERLCLWSGNGFVTKISGNFEGPPGRDPWECNT